MKNTFIGILLLAVIAAGYTQIPWQWRRYKDIEFDGQMRGYHKPIMIAGGLGNIQAQQTHKNEIPEGALLIQLGFHKNKQGWQPNYQKTGSNGYLIIYKDGFAPPYLQYRSGTDKPEWALAE